jgi:hypothetical protein
MVWGKSQSLSVIASGVPQRLGAPIAQQLMGKASSPCTKALTFRTSACACLYCSSPASPSLCWCLSPFICLYTGGQSHTSPPLSQQLPAREHGGTEGSSKSGKRTERRYREECQDGELSAEGKQVSPHSPKGVGEKGWSNGRRKEGCSWGWRELSVELDENSVPTLCQTTH